MTEVLRRCNKLFPTEVGGVVVVTALVPAEIMSNPRWKPGELFVISCHGQQSRTHAHARTINSSSFIFNHMAAPPWTAYL